MNDVVELYLISEEVNNAVNHSAMPYSDVLSSSLSTDISAHYLVPQHCCHLATECAVSSSVVSMIL